MGNQQVSPSLQRSVERMNIIGVNAKIGDGCLHLPTPESTNARIHFNSKNLEWLTYKRDLAIKEGFSVSLIKAAYSGYSDKTNLYKFTVKTDERLTYVYNHSRSEVLESLTKTDLILWYLDDGSWHKVRSTMHLYCNMLNEDEMDVLINRIGGLYGIRPTKRIDRKKRRKSLSIFILSKEVGRSIPARCKGVFTR